MLLTDALDNQVFNLKKNCFERPLKLYLSEQFEQHLTLLDSISEEHIKSELLPNIQGIRDSADLLISTIHSYLSGHLPKAYQLFDEAMLFYKPFLLYDENGGMAKELLLERPYYRARPGHDKRFSKTEMFHLPFSKRAFSNTNRFSIPGLPCLYLCNSIYVCWEELRQPDFDKMQVSKFKQVNTDLNLLNFSQTPVRLQTQLKSFASSRFDYSLPYHRSSISMLVTWPLVIACSWADEIRGAAFRQEYIIPQLLMQWIMCKIRLH